MSTDKYLKEGLWPILVETVHALVLYRSHKAYIRGTIIPDNPDVSATELAAKLNMPMGEVLVILHELEEEKSGVRSV